MVSSKAAFLGAALLLGACTVGPDYQTPAVPLPARYSAQPDGAPAQPGVAAWWTNFQDPMLNGLVARALAGNFDVQTAVAHIREARAQEEIVRGAEYPTVNASAQGGYTRLSSNSLPAALANLGSLNTGSSSSSGGLGLPGESFSTYQLGFDASWEIDLFGAQRRANEAAAARTQSAVWSERDAEVTLAAEVANTYQQYRAFQHRLAIADQTLASEQDLLDFIKVRAAKGLITSLDQSHQQQTIAQLSAQRESLAAQMQASVHALGVLLGMAPNAVATELAGTSESASTDIEIPAGLPSELLQRRPDVRTAERNLAAATADIGVATADLYPKLTLTGTLQLASRSLTNLFETDSILANGAGRLSLPVFDGGVRRATVRLRQAQADEAVLAYRKTVMGALKNVEDALVRLEADRRRVTRLRAAEAEAQDAADTNRVRYSNGLISFIEVLQAQQTWLNARDASTQGQADTAQDVVALYKALGGGWDERRNPPEQETSNARGQ